ncbi:putative transcription factor MADS-type1 family [Arabidopsis thaliana]
MMESRLSLFIMKQTILYLISIPYSDVNNFVGVLRYQTSFKSVKLSCGEGGCGACVVLLSNKRRPTLFSKAADLCLLSGANIAVFVTSPDENSDVVYSFSGYSHASEIVDCYLNGKSPPKTTINPESSKFWWEDPNLYGDCDDLSELRIIEDRLMRTKKHLMDCLEKKENSYSVSKSDQNPKNNGGSSSSSSSSSQIASDFGQNPSTSSPFFYHHSYSSLEPSSQVTTCFDQNPIFSVGSESSSDQFRYLVNEDAGFVDCLFETEEEKNRMIVPQETQTQPMFSEEDQSFWENLDVDDVFGLFNDDTNLEVPLQDHSSTNEEDEFMIDISEYLSEEAMEWPMF